MEKQSHQGLSETVVSVIIPYSASHTPRFMLERAISSVQEQSVETEIHVIEDSESRGPAWARNKGLEQTDSELVAFVDADDMWYPDKLERQLSALNRHEVGLCVEGACAGDSRTVTIDMFIRSILFGNLESLTSTILFDRGQADEMRFNEGLERLEDHLFMIEAAVAGGVCFCDEPLVEIRKHEDGLSERGNPEQIFESRLEVADVLERYPETEQYADRLRSLAYYGLGRQRQLHESPLKSMFPLLRSLRYRPALKPLATLTLTPYYILR